MKKKKKKKKKGRNPTFREESIIFVKKRKD